MTSLGAQLAWSASLPPHLGLLTYQTLSQGPRGSTRSILGCSLAFVITRSIPCLLRRIRSSLFPMLPRGQYRISMPALFRCVVQQRATFEEALTTRAPSEVLASPLQDAIDPAPGRLWGRGCFLA